jgi:hypothetical protein
MVPRFANWGTITVIDERKEIHRVANAHINSKELQLLDSIENKYLPHLDDSSGPGYTLRYNRAELVQKPVPEGKNKKIRKSRTC